MQTILIAHRKGLHNKKKVVITRQKNNSDLQEEYLTSIYNQFLSTGLSYIRHQKEILVRRRDVLCVWEMLSICQYLTWTYWIIRLS